jgi:hypothetical protein
VVACVKNDFLVSKEEMDATTTTTTAIATDFEKGVRLIRDAYLSQVSR